MFTEGYFDGTNCYNATGNPHSKLLTRYPPSVYFSRTPTYELHVYHTNTDYCLYITNLRRFQADVYNLIHAVHAVLTLDQSAECTKEGLLVMAYNSTTCAIYRGEFFQQCTPSANPFFTLEETGFMQSASGLLCFYSEPELAMLIDSILQLTILDEDFITQLLHEYHLDDPDSFAGRCAIGRIELYDEAWRLCNKQDKFYWQYGDADTVLPPHVPSAVYQFTDSFVN